MVNKKVKIILPLVFALIIVSNAYAAATFGAWSGPIWLNPGYQFLVNIIAIDDPHHYVNLTYSVNNGAAQCSPCSCTSPACDPVTALGQWVCTIPNNYSDSTISWDMSAYPARTCSLGSKEKGPADSFTTGPTSILLTKFTSMRANASNSSTGTILIFAAVVVSGSMLFAYRRKVHKG